ncbi:putative uncharacterized protein DDB_G0282133 [Diaphorina citri]|uniref:Uncharacterized protein n=1 Tax=Diaphorina citri TaxID=121845 RepID=A0A3Q0J9R4_DIACI|nr:putative uncharacterized protein DDB_G0282133 [Diaphorina citri]
MIEEVVVDTMADETEMIVPLAHTRNSTSGQYYDEYNNRPYNRSYQQSDSRYSSSQDISSDKYASNETLHRQNRPYRGSQSDLARNRPRNIDNRYERNYRRDGEGDYGKNNQYNNGRRNSQQYSNNNRYNNRNTQDPVASSPVDIPSSDPVDLTSPTSDPMEDNVGVTELSDQLNSTHLTDQSEQSPRSAVFKAWNSKPRGLEFESQQQHEKRNRKVMYTTENSRNDDNSNPIPDSQDSGPPTTNHRSAVLNQSTKSYERNDNVGVTELSDQLNSTHLTDQSEQRSRQQNHRGGHSDGKGGWGGGSSFRHHQGQNSYGSSQDYNDRYGEPKRKQYNSNSTAPPGARGDILILIWDQEQESNPEGEDNTDGSNSVNLAFHWSRLDWTESVDEDVWVTSSKSNEPQELPRLDPSPPSSTSKPSPPPVLYDDKDWSAVRNKPQSDDTSSVHRRNQFQGSYWELPPRFRKKFEQEANQQQPPPPRTSNPQPPSSYSSSQPPPSLGDSPYHSLGTYSDSQWSGESVEVRGTYSDSQWSGESVEVRGHTRQDNSKFNSLPPPGRSRHEGAPRGDYNRGRRFSTAYDADTGDYAARPNETDQPQSLPVSSVKQDRPNETSKVN